MYDVIVIGAGVVGSAVARELSRYDLRVCVLDREEDVGCGTSKANSAIIHAGFDALPGTRKARFNVEGNRMMDDLSRDLDIPFKRNGALVVALREEDIPKLRELMDRGTANGVPGMVLMDGEEARKMEPALSKSIPAALYAPTSGIVCPFEMTEALAENACVNGVEFLLETAVESIEMNGNSACVRTDRGEMTARCVVNCAGLDSARLHNQVCPDTIEILPRRGEYMLLDRKTGGLVHTTVFQAPSAMGKGILVTPTAHGNTLLGPTAVNDDDAYHTATTAEGLAQVMEVAALSVPNLPTRQVITSFAGMRAHLTGDDDFRLGMPVEGYFEAAGIESPGLTSAPAIGVYMAEEIAAYLKAEKKTSFISTRRVTRPSRMSFEERSALIAENPAFGNIICRCETVSEGEILEAIHRPLGAKSMDGIKRRTRAGMGRCQSGFCSTRVMEILRRELGENFAVTKNGPGSEMIITDREER